MISSGIKKTFHTKLLIIFKKICLKSKFTISRSYEYFKYFQSKESKSSELGKTFQAGIKISASYCTLKVSKTAEILEVRWR